MLQFMVIKINTLATGIKFNIYALYRLYCSLEYNVKGIEVPLVVAT